MTRKRLSMRFEDWPLEDRALWVRAFRSTDIFDDRGVAAKWRPKTVNQARYAYSRWLHFVNEVDPAVLVIPAADRVTLETVRKFVLHESERIAAISLGALLGHLVLALRAIAPERDWTWLTSIQRRQLARGKARDKRPLIVSAHELVDFGHRLMASASSNEEVHDIVAYRDGLMIALLASRPLRRKNLAEIRLDKHVSISGKHVRLSFEAHEMKGGRAFECTLPAFLVDPFLRYVYDVRLRFPGAANHECLWCSIKEGPLGSEAIYRAIIKRTADAFGKRVYPHLFRDAASSSLAIERPDQVMLARDLLGHASFKTTETHYLHAESMKAGVRYLDVLESKRGQRVPRGPDASS